MDIHDKNMRKRRRNPQYIISLCKKEENVNISDRYKKNKITVEHDDNNIVNKKSEYHMKKEYDTRNKCALKTKATDDKTNELENSINHNSKLDNFKLEKEDKIEIEKISFEDMKEKLINEKVIKKKCDIIYNTINSQSKITKSENGKLNYLENKDNIINERFNKSVSLSEHDIYKNIEQIPVIHTTMEELSNPILFFEKYNSIGLKYGAVKVKPPKFFKPQFNPYYLNMKFNIRKQKINELKYGKEFDHPEEYWSLYEVYKYNEMLEVLHLPKHQTGLEYVERKYWNIINNEKEEIVSIYGADLPVSKNHPTCLFQNSLKIEKLKKNKSRSCDSNSISNSVNKPQMEMSTGYAKGSDNIKHDSGYKRGIPGDVGNNMSPCDNRKMNNYNSVSYLYPYNNNNINNNGNLCNNSIIIKEEIGNKGRNEIIDVINISDDENLKIQSRYSLSKRMHAQNQGMKLANCVNDSNNSVCTHSTLGYSNNNNYRNSNSNSNNNCNSNSISNCHGNCISNCNGNSISNCNCRSASNCNSRSTSNCNSRSTSNCNSRSTNNCNSDTINSNRDNSEYSNSYLRDKYVKKKVNPFLKQKKEKYYLEINNIINGISENLNIKSLPFIKGSMLKNVDISIEGVNIPWLYVGTLFSSFCWHTEDNYFASINYQHWGKPKIWYVIPPRYSDKVEDVIYEYLKENSKRKKKKKKKVKNKKKQAKNVIPEELKRKLKERASTTTFSATPCMKNYKRVKNMHFTKNSAKFSSTSASSGASSASSTRSSSSTSTTKLIQENCHFLDVDINDVDLLYRKSCINYKIIDKKQIHFKKENNKNKIYKLTIQVPIEVFLKNNIPVFKNIQTKNEFIFLWPKTFHGGFNSGYNCNEACNIAPTFWLFYGLQSYYNYKYFRNTCISIHFILFSNILHYQEYTFSQLKHIIYTLRYILTDEYKFFKDSKTIFVDFTLNRDALLNNKLMNYSKHISLDLTKMYTNFECQKNKHFFFENIKSKLEFFYKDCDACNSPTFNSSIICPHSNDILCIHCSDEHSCNCKFKVALKRYTLLEMMKLLTLLIHYANKIKTSNERDIEFDDIPDYNSLKIFEDKNSIKLYNMIRETKKSEVEKRSKSTNYIDLENYCLERINNVGNEKRPRDKMKKEKNFVLEDYYTSSNHFKTKLTLKYFLLTYEEEMEDNPLKILPKIIA
ncbi:JmjC domain-containing protein 1 [Plasmodium brasilianum]|uniref:JmjC domain-containing protein 1 n=1 Tax=Plasmodium brasilianum TaxID=5824 RepID=A0ACB9Y2S6_PLABR|nr:JmjC domain-containing protein 1 [Plasmodium brasilianum]